MGKLLNKKISKLLKKHYEMFPSYLPNILTNKTIDMEGIVIDTSEKSLKEYFLMILDLKESGNEFPVDLDLVWPLAYKRKDHAIRDLRELFIQDVDFSPSQLGKVVNINDLANGVKVEILISVSCLEYLIARKVRRVFDVYRQVFHVVVKEKSNSIELPKNYAEALRQLADKVEANEILQSKVIQLTPKAEYFDHVLKSKTLITTTVIAKELGMSAEKLNFLLSQKGVQYKVDDTWVLYKKYQDLGYTKTKTHNYLDKAGNDRTSIHTYWTEKGREFIINNFSK